MRKTIGVLAVGTVLATGAFHVSAQGPSDEWKARNGIGERYEGIDIDPEVSAGFRMIAFMVLSNPDPREAIDVTRDDEIVVDFYSRSASSYTLTARELDPSKGYWMEPKIRPNAVAGFTTFKGIWKTDLLRKWQGNPRTKVPVPGLGALVWFQIDTQSIEHVAPAVMRAAGAKPLLSPSAYRATFLPDMVIDDVAFTVRGGCQLNGTAKTFPGGGSVGKQLPGSAFYVDLTMIPPGYSGDVMLEMITPPEKKTRYCFAHPSASR
jgi:hypothetical protein